MNVLSEYKIPYLGLKDGQHPLSYKVGNAFFTSFDRSDIEADIDLHVMFDKKSTMVVCDFSFEGTLTLPCDRCNEDVKVDIEGEEKVIFKFGNEDESDDENIFYIPPSLGELDLSPQVFELILVNFPLRAVHEDLEDCNPDVIAKLKELKPKVNINPEWEELLKLKSK